MCKFFSVCSTGDGKPLYFDARIRKDIIKKKSKYESADSHTSIADHFGHKGLDEDKLNKYEYDVWNKHLEVDHLGTKDDSNAIKDFCDKLDFTTIVPELRIKPIINPFKDIQTLEVTKADIKLLKEWDSVWDSVRDSVWDSVRDSVGDSVRDSVGDSVRDSVWDSVRDSVWDSVRDSVGAYIATFVDTKYKFDFSSAQKLWERGLVAIFDGENWRLHGKGGKEVYKITQTELRRTK
jgi:hypothetical protein